MRRPPSIVVSDSIRLVPMMLDHASAMIGLVHKNRAHLGTWLPWVDHMQTTQDFEQFITAAHGREEVGVEQSWLIFYNGELAGRIGLHYINRQHRQGSIGYWLGQEFEGKGLVTQACAVIVDHGFTALGLNRIELRCGTGNSRSAAIPARLGFVKEGVLREAELVNEKFIDLTVYSLLRSDWNKRRSTEEQTA